MKLGLLASAFDPFPHPGHLYAMRQAINAGACEAILAAVHSDPSIERPAKRKPAMTVPERVMMLRALHYVHEVVIYETEAFLQEIIRDQKPACLIAGEDHRDDRVTGEEYAPVFWARRLPEWSSTQFARRIAESLPDVAASLRFTKDLDPCLLSRYAAKELIEAGAVYKDMVTTFDAWKQGLKNTT